MENEVSQLQKELKEKAKTEIGKGLQVLSNFLHSDESRKILDHTDLRVYIKLEDDKTKSIDIRSIFSSSGFKDILIEKLLPRVEKTITKDFIHKTNNPEAKAQPSSSSKNDEIIENAISGHIEKLNNQVAEKRKERTYLFNFLSSCYKGSAAKEKAEKELIYLDREIDAMRFAIPSQDDLPF